MSFLFHRHPENPIVQPGIWDWRRAVVFNPGAIAHGNKVYLVERAAGGLRPFHCVLGLLESTDGIHFSHTVDHPVFTPGECGSEHGSVQDPRLVRLDERFYMTFAFRPYAWASHPTGTGVPESYQVEYPGFSGRDEDNQTRSGIAVSDNLIEWKVISWINDPGTDDRNVILFPEKINGRYAVLRRPSPRVGTGANHLGPPPGIQISYSSDMQRWTDPVPVLTPAFPWESNRIGGSTPPLRTRDGWLVLYHGVETQDEASRRVCYRTGVALLDTDDPTMVRARCPFPVLEPAYYYERTGLYIPQVVFPTGLIQKEDTLLLYYGVCDTAIALASASLKDLLSLLHQHRLDLAGHGTPYGN